MLIPRVSLNTSTRPGPPIAWDETDCLLCGQDNAELILEAPDPSPYEGIALLFAVVRCRHCGLCYTNPRPDPETIMGFYPREYRPHDRHRDRSRPRSIWNRLLKRSSPERTGDIPIRGEGRLLDFGCGGGSYLRRMSERGWKVTGVDMSPEAVERVRMDLGFPAYLGTLPHHDLRPCTFDLVTMWHSLEHVHDPLSSLRESFRLLVPGGQIVIACPNWDGWAARWFQTDWYSLDLPRHLVHFTPVTLREMLAVAGFEVQSIRSLRHAEWLRSSARRAANQHPVSLLTRPLTLKPVARMASGIIDLFGGSDCMLVTATRPE